MYLFAVWKHPVVVGVVGEGLLDSVYRAIDVGFRHAGDLDRHLGMNGGGSLKQSIKRFLFDKGGLVKVV